jgi:hypothetical protein
MNSLAPKSRAAVVALAGVWASAIVAAVLMVISALGDGGVSSLLIGLIAFGVAVLFAVPGAFALSVAGPCLQRRTGMGKRVSFASVGILGVLLIAVASAALGLGQITFAAISFGLPVGALTGLIASAAVPDSSTPNDVPL